MRVHPKNKLYDREIKMYFYLAKVGFEPTPTSTAAPSNTETTVIPTRPLRSLKKELSWSRFMLVFSAYPSDRATMFRCANTIIYIQGKTAGSLYIFNIINYFQASVSIRSRYSLYIDDCVSKTKHIW